LRERERERERESKRERVVEREREREREREMLRERDTCTQDARMHQLPTPGHGCSVQSSVPAASGAGS